MKLYHRTTDENKRSIEQNGFKTTPVYFSTTPTYSESKLKNCSGVVEKTVDDSDITIFKTRKEYADYRTEMLHTHGYKTYKQHIANQNKGLLFPTPRGNVVIIYDTSILE